MQLSRPLEVYRELSLITGTADFPAVATVATAAGPADSTLLLVGLSLPNSALRFQRADPGFSAGYVVSLRAVRDSQLTAVADRRETVRVPTFAETARTDESVLFQTSLTVGPGTHVLTIRVRDELSARGFERTDTVRVPAYGVGGASVMAPVPVYRAEPRGDRADPPELLLNPRHTAAYGGAGPSVYLERYGAGPVRLELHDADGVRVWSREMPERDDTVSGVIAHVVELPGDSLSMGRFRLLAVAGADTAGPVPLLVTLTDRWVATNFMEVMELLRSIAPASELDALLEAAPGERRALWDAFWDARDPVPATPANEYRDAFFERVRVATLRFGEPGLAGWRTDRGQVYIVLGPPSRQTELRYDSRMTGRPRGQEWVYQRVPGGGRLSLVFLDRTGSGTFRLTRDSEMAFRAVVQRIKNRDR